MSTDDTAGASARPLTVPAHLAERLRVAAGSDEDPQALVERYLGLIAAILEGEDGGRPHRWFLGYLVTDDGPTPPTSFERMAGDYPRWRARPFRPQAPSTDDEEAAEVEACSAGAELLVLHRDDGVRAIVETLPTRGEVVVAVLGAGRRAERTLALDRDEAWLDFGTRAWRRVMSAADAVADELVTMPSNEDEGGSGDETPA